MARRRQPLPVPLPPVTPETEELRRRFAIEEEKHRQAELLAAQARMRAEQLLRSREATAKAKALIAKLNRDAEERVEARIEQIAIKKAKLKARNIIATRRAKALLKRGGSL